MYMFCDSNFISKEMTVSSPFCVAWYGTEIPLWMGQLGFAPNPSIHLACHVVLPFPYAPSSLLPSPSSFSSTISFPSLMSLFPFPVSCYLGYWYSLFACCSNVCLLYQVDWIDLKVYGYVSQFPWPSMNQKHEMGLSLVKIAKRENWRSVREKEAMICHKELKSSELSR